MIDLMNSVIIFLILIDPTQMANFPTQIPDCDYHNPALLDFFLSSDASISVSIDFTSAIEYIIDSGRFPVPLL